MPNDEKRPSAKGDPLDPTVQRRLAAFVQAVGEYRGADQLHVSRAVLARALGGLGLRRGSILQIEVGLSMFTEPR